MTGLDSVTEVLFRVNDKAVETPLVDANVVNLVQRRAEKQAANCVDTVV